MTHTRKVYFENAADMPLFCGEDLNFGAFLKLFHQVITNGVNKITSRTTKKTKI
jgi:hypothetical protein